MNALRHTQTHIREIVVSAFSESGTVAVRSHTDNWRNMAGGKIRKQRGMKRKGNESKERKQKEKGKIIDCDGTEERIREK